MQHDLGVQTDIRNVGNGRLLVGIFRVNFENLSIITAINLCRLQFRKAIQVV